MKKTILFLIILIIAKSGFAQDPEIIWSKGVGGKGYDVGYRIMVDAKGNIYTLGVFSDTVDFDPNDGTSRSHAIGQNPNIFISKWNSSGEFLWNKTFGGDITYCSSIAVGQSGNIYLSGMFSVTVDFDPGPGIFNVTSNTGENNMFGGSPSRDIFILKLDSSGNFIWVKATGGKGQDSGIGIVLDAMENIFITGNFEKTVDFDLGIKTDTINSKGEIDVFVSKLTSDGKFLWAKSFGSKSQDDVWSIAIDVEANLYLAGRFYGTVDFDPGPGIFNIVSPDDSWGNMFISKLDKNGNFVWAKKMAGAPGSTYNYSIAVDVNKNVYSTGTFLKTVDFDPGAKTYNLVATDSNGCAFVSKLDVNGNFAWAKSLGSAVYNEYTSITLDKGGSVLLTTTVYGNVDLDSIDKYDSRSIDYNVMFYKFDPKGNLIWKIPYGGRYKDVCHSIAIDFFGNFYATGAFYLPIDFGQEKKDYRMFWEGHSDIFILKLSNPKQIKRK